MESFGIYLLKSGCWLTGFAIVYLLFLQNERFFMLKRAYLITGMVISVIFPFISIHYQVELPPADFNGVDLTSPVVSMNTPDQQSTGTSFDYRFIVLFLYLSGAVFLMYKMVRHILVLYKTINKVTSNSKGPAKLVRISGFSSSFSFFNYIFINPTLNEAEAEEIVNHELVHVKQKHWFDLLMIEVLRMVQWINPFAWVYSGFIRQNHEYLADEEALRCTTNPGNYRAALLNQLFNSPVISLSNSLNYSLNKKRFDMMKTRKTPSYRKLKILLVLPVFAVVFYAFSTPEYHYSRSNETSETSGEMSVASGRTVKGVVFREDGKAFSGVQIIVTGTKYRTTTDEKGNFTIENVPENTFLVFSHVGYKTLMEKSQFTGAMKIKLLKDPEYKVQTPVRTTATQPAVSPGKNPEDFPTFRGERITEFRHWVQRQLQYPAGAMAKKLEGWVNVSFTVEADGTVSNVKFTGSADPLLGDAVVQVVKSSPKWEPAKNPEMQVPYQTSLAVKFSLPDIISREEAYVVVENMPRYPGGDAGLLKFIANTTHYPEAAKAQNIQGRVIVRFIVNKEGNAEDITVLRSVHPLLDAEAGRVVGLLKGFAPGLQGGKPVSVYYMVPITFTLSSEFPETKQEQPVSPTGVTTAEETRSTREIVVVGYKDGTSPAGPLKIQNADGSPANPLFIVDGKQGDKKMLETIDPNNIESISVLKDESATAVYGEKGKNGVIIVTLKKKVRLVP